MKRWEFWPQATWASVCVAIVLAVWAPYLVRGQPVLWLRHDGTATIVAGAIQAAVAAMAIVFSAAQARAAYQRNRKQREQAERFARIDQYGEALSMIDLAQKRLKALAGVISNPRLGSLDAAQFAIDSIQMHVDALARFPFERLNAKDAQVFETAYQNVLYARATARGFMQQVQSRSARNTRDDLLGSHIFDSDEQDRVICAEEIADTAEGITEAVELLRAAHIRVGLPNRSL